VERYPNQFIHMKDDFLIGSVTHTGQHQEYRHKHNSG
jgi:hypothetical protein